jgi:DNA-binding CsgD family transcriptional regulator
LKVKKDFDGQLFVYSAEATAKFWEFGNTFLSVTATGKRRILLLIAEYKSSKELAEELFVHPRTVDSHRNNISRKLDIYGHKALLKFAVENKREL